MAVAITGRCPQWLNPLAHRIGPVNLIELLVHAVDAINEHPQSFVQIRYQRLGNATQVPLSFVCQLWRCLSKLAYMLWRQDAVFPQKAADLIESCVRRPTRRLRIRTSVRLPSAPPRCSFAQSIGAQCVCMPTINILAVANETNRVG